MNEITHELHERQKEDIFVLLHGIKVGIDDPFMQQIMMRLDKKNQSVVAFNFPYIDRGEKQPTSDLSEEVNALHTAVTDLKQRGYENIHIIAKSLGGIVASEWLKQNPDNPNVDLGILGYVLGDVRTAAIKDHLRIVVQGDHDRFGDGNAVRAELAAHGVAAKVIELTDADHSFRDATSKPAHQKEAIRAALNNL